MGFFTATKIIRTVTPVVTLIFIMYCLSIGNIQNSLYGRAALCVSLFLPRFIFVFLSGYFMFLAGPKTTPDNLVRTAIFFIIFAFVFAHAALKAAKRS